MSVISNLNTRQTPNPVAGQTGTQSIKFIAGPRVYMKAVDTVAAPPTTKSNGTLPAGWTDLGIVNGVAKVTYNKSLKEVRTGIEQVLRAEYIDKKTANVECDLAQFDDTLVTQMTGLTASVITAGSIVQFGLGQEGIVNKAVLFVLQNLLDGKEIQLYNPNSMMTFAYNNSGDEVSVKLTGEFLFFTWGGADTAFVQSHFA